MVSAEEQHDLDGAHEIVHAPPQDIGRMAYVTGGKRAGWYHKTFPLAEDQDVRREACNAGQRQAQRMQQGRKQEEGNRQEAQIPKEEGYRKEECISSHHQEDQQSMQ